MDLEAFGETEASETAERQESLLSDMLTVASVPCILVRNYRESLRFVDKIIAKMVEL